MTEVTPPTTLLIPRVWDLPRCDAQRQQTYANDTPETDRRCKRAAKVQLGDKHLCLRHAEVTALQILLDRTARGGLADATAKPE